MPVAQASGLHQARSGRFESRKTSCLRTWTPDQSSSIILLADAVTMRYVHRSIEDISFQINGNFDNAVATRRISTLRRRSLQRGLSSAPPVAGNSGLFLERRIAPRDHRGRPIDPPSRSDRGRSRQRWPFPSGDDGLGRAGSGAMGAALVAGESVKPSGFGVFTVRKCFDNADQTLHNGISRAQAQEASRNQCHAPVERVSGS